MPRIFASLAIAALALLVLTATIALTDDNSAPDRHILLAVGTLLLSCFIQVLGFTYLTVSGKVIAQAAHLANLDPACLMIAKKYKRSFTRLLALLVVSIVLSAATGGAAWRSHDARVAHIPAVMIAVLIHAWAYRAQHKVLSGNAGLVETTLRVYSEWRDRRVTDKTTNPPDAE